MPASLRDLLAALPPDAIVDASAPQDIAVDAPVVESSRDVQPGGLFVARQGDRSDGHDFIPDAIEAGAAAVIGERELDGLPVPYIRLRDPQEAIGYLSAAWHGFPSRKLAVIGLTGTDGKTTTCHLLHSILKRVAGIRAGYISTISADFGAETAATGLHVTTPGAPRTQAYLAAMAEAGLTHCILEMTSHGLAQGRLNGVDIDVAVVTNITHEHLDFHGSWEAYRDAKARMFKMLADARRKPGRAKVAVINADDPSAAYMARFPADSALTYGIESGADFQAGDILHRPASTVFRLGQRQIELPLPGRFNIANALAAIAAARALELPWSAIERGIAGVEQIPGRMERIDEGQDFTTIVDFAHTPNALRRALEAGRQMLAPGARLIAVFGSAGLRDVQKRRLMAETAAGLADVTVLTAEDPRTESLDDILQMMAAGCRAQGGVEGETFVRLRDRGEAIFQACQLARAGDLVIACGKGHEQSMCFGETEHPWDDRAAMRSALRGKPVSSLPTARVRHAPR